MNERAASFQQQLDADFPDKDVQLPQLTHDLRLVYIASFAFFSLFFIAAAAYLSHSAIRRVNRDLVQFKQAIKTVESADDLKQLNIQPNPLFFKELTEALISVNHLARRLESNLVDKQLLQAALDESLREDEMAAEILYGHLIEKNADDPLGITHRIQSSSHFSGDIILVRRSPSGSIFVLLADATGHGLSATITIMPVISAFDALVKKGHRMPFILREINKRLLKDLPDDRFVAATLIELDPIDQELRLWNGGMPECLLLGDQGQVVERFQSQHMALGILSDELFDTLPARLPLPQKGHFFSCSDGLIEQTSPKGQIFGLDGLLAGVHQYTSDQLVLGLLKAVKCHADKDVPDDDISLLLIDFERLSSHLAPAQGCQISQLTIPDAPFEWQLRIHGEQLISQAIPALMIEFLQTLGLQENVIRKVFIVARELTARALHDNLLQLPADLKQTLMEAEGEAGLTHYYKQRRKALYSLNPDSFLEVKLISHPGQGQQASYLEMQVRDNGQGKGSLPLDNESLLCHYSELEILEGGHFIKARF